MSGSALLATSSTSVYVVFNIGTMPCVRVKKNVTTGACVMEVEMEEAVEDEEPVEMEEEQEEEVSQKRETINEMGPAVHLWFDKPCRLIITGQSDMGKTTLAVDIILTRILKNVRRCYAACPTFNEQPALEKLRNVPGAFPREHVFTTVDDDVFESIHAALVARPAPTLLFVDDAAAEASTNKGHKGSFSRLCLASRHIHLYIVGIFQSLKSCSPSLRYNTEGLISFLPRRVTDIDILAEEFNPAPARANSKKWVAQALDHCWKNWRFAFIYREGFTGITHYYCGFDEEIEVPEEFDT